MKLLRQAKEICYTCPSRRPCLFVALKRGENFGVWGGFTKVERARLMKRNRHRVDLIMKKFDDGVLDGSSEAAP